MAARQRDIVEDPIRTGAVYKNTTNNISAGLNSAIELCFMQLFAKAYEELACILGHLDVLENAIVKPDPHRQQVLKKAWDDLARLQKLHKKALRSSGFAK